MTFTGEDGPQHTAADAYQHGADLTAALATRVREYAPAQFPWVRVEYVEHLAAGLAARAEEARDRDRQ